MKKLILLIVLCAFSFSLPSTAARHGKLRRHKHPKHFHYHVHHTQPFGTYPGI